jgi:hypothetical protein
MGSVLGGKVAHPFVGWMCGSPSRDSQAGHELFAGKF